MHTIVAEMCRMSTEEVKDESFVRLSIGGFGGISVTVWGRQ